MKKATLLFIYTIFSAFGFLQAQDSGRISGKVLDPDGATLPYANILLNATKDSTLVKVEVSDDDGNFTFFNIPAGDYFVSMSYVGMSDYSGSAFALRQGEKKTLEDIQVENVGEELDEVTVTAKRPMIEVKPGKVVFNIEGSINAAGNNALELLRKSPGVLLDNNENITLMGKSGVRVYINDRPSRLGADDLANYLKTLDGNQIEAIEIITNPGARYEAEGNAGIINIKLKKNKNFGTNGSIAANASLGIDTLVADHPKLGANFNLNHRNKFMNIYGGYGYFDGKGFNYERITRENNGNSFVQAFNNTWDNQSHNYKLGLDYFINEKQTLGFLFNGNNSTGLDDGFNMTDTDQFENGVLLQDLLLARTTGFDENQNYDLNVNYQIKGKNGLFWNVDLDYGTYINSGQNIYNNRNFERATLLLKTDVDNDDIRDRVIDIYSAKLDHERKIGKGKLGIGIKSALVSTENSFDFYQGAGVDRILIDTASNDFNYDENVNAAYVTYSTPLNQKWSGEFGFRVENSITKGELIAIQDSDDNLVERNFTDYFPSIGFSYQHNQKNQFQFSYGRRIDRPNYQNLNPFVYYINEYTSATGDPFLRPQYTHNIQVSHTFAYRFNTTLKFSHTKDLNTRFSELNPDIVNDDGVIIGEIFTWKNLQTQRHYSLGFSAPYTPKEWWNTYTNISLYRLENEGDYGDGKVVDIQANAANIYMQHTFSLSDNITFELSGWANTPAIWGGNFVTKSMWSLNAGLQTKVLKGNGTIKAGVDDIFQTAFWRAESTFGALNMDGLGGWDSRRVKLSFNYNFGNEKVKSRKRATGLEDEKKRTSEEGGM